MDPLPDFSKELWARPMGPLPTLPADIEASISPLPNTLGILKHLTPEQQAILGSDEFRATCNEISKFQARRLSEVPPFDFTFSDETLYTIRGSVIKFRKTNIPKRVPSDNFLSIDVGRGCKDIDGEVKSSKKLFGRLRLIDNQDNTYLNCTNIVTPKAFEKSYLEINGRRSKGFPEKYKIRNEIYQLLLFEALKVSQAQEFINNTPMEIVGRQQIQDKLDRNQLFLQELGIPILSYSDLMILNQERIVLEEISITLGFVSSREILNDHTNNLPQRLASKHKGKINQLSEWQREVNRQIEEGLSTVALLDREISFIVDRLPSYWTHDKGRFVEKETYVGYKGDMAQIGVDYSIVKGMLIPIKTDSKRYKVIPQYPVSGCMLDNLGTIILDEYGYPIPADLPRICIYNSQKRAYMPVDILHL